MANNARIDIVVPNAVNIVLMVNENLVDNLRLAKEADLELPSLYRRAKLAVHELGEMAVVRQEVEDK